MRHQSYFILILSVIMFSNVACDLSSNGDIPDIEVNNSEDDLRNSLNIPEDAERVIIFSHAAHMDWDWLNPFPYNVDKSGAVYDPGYFPNGNATQSAHPSDSILTLATKNILADSGYYYSVCEMGFLKEFSKHHPELFDSLKLSQRLRIVGGGITSPDNLLPNGETFFRNFLVANQWLKSVDVPWSQQVWLPDDFGHDPQLPVMLQALDAMGVGFARIPGASDGNPQAFMAPAESLLNTSTGGVDFFWKSADSSRVIAHWLQDHYNQGEKIDDGTCLQPNTLQNIGSYIKSNGPVSPTPYIYVQVSDDFMVPFQQIVCDAKEWNESKDANNSYKATGVYAVVATFDQYTRLVNFHQEKLKTRSYSPVSPNASNTFQPNPYWMGYYASRPELKTKHNEATRLLLAAELFQVISCNLTSTNSSQKQGQINALLAAWDSLAPSTHHDYITGTAVDNVYGIEQLNLLDKALSLGTNLKSQFMAEIAADIQPASSSIVVFNQLGIPNSGVVKYKEGYLNVSAPSMGYRVNDLSTAAVGDNTLKANSESTNFSLSNGLISANFDMKNGNLLSVVDGKTQKNIFAENSVGNEIVLFLDQGGIYRFGYEYDKTFIQQSATWDQYEISIDTSNALQKSLSVKKVLTKIGNSSTSKSFVVTYSLRQGESFLRISTKGSLPQNYTAMVKFPLTNSVDHIVAGTPYHWNTTQTTSYGDNPSFNATFWATHDFVIPKSNETTLAAIYHGSTPAWTAVDNDLYGVILRNTPANAYGAGGSDDGIHVQEYALRVPSGIGSADSGQPLREARQYNTPMTAIALPSSGGGKLPSSYSLASTDNNAFITAAKWSYSDTSALILRVYQPSNLQMNCTLNLNPEARECTVVSALEVPIVNSEISAGCSPSGTGQYKLTLPRAVATFEFK